MSRPCSHGRAGRRADVPPPVRGPLDALSLITLAAATPSRPETICLLMDASRRGGTCVVVDGTDDDEAIESVADFVLAAIAELGAGVGVVDAVVLASVRPGRGAPGDSDHWRWFALRDRFEDAGIDLLDWFVLGRGATVSMAELTDSHVRW